MALLEYYHQLIDNSKGIIEMSLNDNHAEYSKCQAFLDDLNEWKAVIENRFEKELYFYAINEYQRSIYLALQGSYRHSFMALRFFIEHTCAAIYFSTREMEFRLWTKAELDISWSKITDEDIGIFSTKFIKLYFSDLNSKAGEFRGLAKKTYRECSEYTHGNYGTYENIDLKLSYNKQLSDRYINLAGNAKILIIFLLTARFYKEIDLSLNPNILNTITDHIGFIEYFAYQNK
ncbi:hypothetical protein [Lysinibacillus sp. NPDC056232]|uniref:hypothetical protein n=1 Tax=Lysinibacillus sp. NPDC056232 TaxID=3345756 RepID=UPI0035D79C09